ncbi:MAG TPA: hypothetical protein VLN26_00225 [Gaiellaceae bacterium]|nr:hypothetical protein [Gaiellaceae bacterium]
MFASAYSGSGTDTGSAGAGGGGGTGVLPVEATRRTARWRMTPSVILRTRETSSSVAASAAKVSRW